MPEGSDECKKILDRIEEQGKAAGLAAKEIAIKQKDKLLEMLAGVAAFENLAPAVAELNASLDAVLTPHFTASVATLFGLRKEMSELDAAKDAKEEAKVSTIAALRAKRDAERNALCEAHERALDALDERTEAAVAAENKSAAEAQAAIQARGEALQEEGKVVVDALRCLGEAESVPATFAPAKGSVDKVRAIKVAIDKGFEGSHRDEPTTEAILKDAFNAMCLLVGPESRRGEGDRMEDVFMEGLKDAHDEVLHTLGIKDFVKRPPPSEMLKEMEGAAGAALAEITKMLAAL